MRLRGSFLLSGLWKGLTENAEFGNDDEDEPAKGKALIEEEDDDISPIDSLDAAADAEEEEEEEIAVRPCPNTLLYEQAA